MDSKTYLKEVNPHDKANIFSKFFIWWSFPLFKRGHKNDNLCLEDLWQARSHDLSGDLGDRLEEAWATELEKSKISGNKPSLTKAIISCFWFQYMMCGFLVGFLYIVLWPMIPYSLNLFIKYFSTKKTAESYRDAHIYNILMNFSSILAPIVLSHVDLLQGCVGMRVRIACCSLLYRKILKLNKAGLNKTEPGQVINLMSNDVNRFDIVALYLHYLWVTPIVVPVVSYLVWQQVAWATLAGLGVIFLQTILVQTFLSNWQGRLRGQIAKRTDERVKVMSELVNGVQVIKMYAWEKPFEKLVDRLRKYEVKYVMQTSMIKGFSTALMVFTERLILCAAIVTFALTGGVVRAGIAFSLVQYYNLLQLACNIYFPWAIAFYGEAKVSVRRIEEFLSLEEIEPTEEKANNLNHITNGSNNIKSEYIKTKLAGVVISNVSASWHSNPIIYTLKNINLSVKPGDFIGVAGLVGSGKTSLLQLVLGELQPTQGTVSLGGAKISYASQEPWLFVATIRQNILFGLPYDRSRYLQVVAACALLRDFEQLPSGDATLVGERGISLSGGQRARIGLARACYRHADIYLLDDPLSAVDTHVGKHLISECVMGLLKHSTRILVTHQLHHLKNADKIIILRNGEIDSEGSFTDVSRMPLFEQMLEEEEQTDVEMEIKLMKALERKQSIMSVKQSRESFSKVGETELDELDEPGETAEMMEQGKVSGSVYTRYFRAGGSWALLVFTVISFLLAQVITSASDLWLTHWMNDVEAKFTHDQEYSSSYIKDNSAGHFNSTIPENSTESQSNFTYADFTDTTTANINTAPNTSIIGTIVKTALTLQTIEPDGIFNHSYYVYVWVSIMLACTLVTTYRSLLFMWVCMRSSIKLHNKMFSNILSATMRFFDTNSSGRILNRFSKDMGIIDEILPKLYLESIQIFMVMFGIIVMVAIVNPYMILTTLFCGVLMYFWSMTYLKTAQAIKRLEGVSRSPVFSHVSASMAGLGTIRACGAQDMLRAQFDDKQDVHTAAWYLTLVTNATFSIWLSIITSLYVIIVAYTFLLLDNGTTKSGNVGLAISQGLILVVMMQYGIKQAAQVVTQMTSVERVLQFTSLPQEKSSGSSAPKGWPQHTRIVFKDLYLRYDSEAEPVLKNLNITIESGWKVGVVGRTGAGKSSLIAALFRLAPVDGHIYIDDLDTSGLVLQELRSKISIIPQEPVLFSASLRYNLDPFDKYSDADIWNALEQVELKGIVTSLSSGVESGGSNFSAGQRQLLCLARAALARNRLLVLDEATANVDPNTDALIQRSLRKFFTDCTVVTVAHRLHTVADADRIIWCPLPVKTVSAPRRLPKLKIAFAKLRHRHRRPHVIVMEAGQVVEFGQPHGLLLKEDGYFTRMVKELSPASEQSLRSIANVAYLSNNPHIKDDYPEPAVLVALEKLKFVA